MHVELWGAKNVQSFDANTSAMVKLSSLSISLNTFLSHFRSILLCTDTIFLVYLQMVIVIEFDTSHKPIFFFNQYKI